jgi:hypothetical protein
MALSIARRDEIAFRFVIHRLSEKPMKEFFGELPKLFHEAGMRTPMMVDLRDQLLRGIELYVRHGPEQFRIPAGTYVGLAWPLAVLIACKRNKLVLGEQTARNVGSEHKALGASKQEAMEFAALLAKEIYSDIFAEYM